MEDPSLAPEEHKDPDGDEGVREAQEPPGDEIPPKLSDTVHHELNGEPPALPPCEPPAEAGDSGQEGAEVVEEGGVVVARFVEGGREAVTIRRCHAGWQPCPPRSRCFEPGSQALPVQGETVSARAKGDGAIRAIPAEGRFRDIRVPFWPLQGGMRQPLALGLLRLAARRNDDPGLALDPGVRRGPWKVARPSL